MFVRLRQFTYSFKKIKFHHQTIIVFPLESVNTSAAPLVRFYLRRPYASKEGLNVPSSPKHLRLQQILVNELSAHFVIDVRQVEGEVRTDISEAAQRRNKKKAQLNNTTAKTLQSRITYNSTRQPQ